LLGIWIAIDSALEQNGCLWFIPGSHKDEECRQQSNGYHFVRTKNALQGNNHGALVEFAGTRPVYGVGERKFIPVEVKKGSLVLINGNVVHKSDKKY